MRAYVDAARCRKLPARQQRLPGEGVILVALWLLHALTYLDHRCGGTLCKLLWATIKGRVRQKLSSGLLRRYIYTC